MLDVQWRLGLAEKDMVLAKQLKSKLSALECHSWYSAFVFVYLGPWATPDYLC